MYNPFVISIRKEVPRMRKPRDIGQPTVVCHTLPGTPEQIAANRERLRQACESALSQICGCPMEVTLDFGDGKRRKSEKAG